MTFHSTIGRKVIGNRTLPALVLALFFLHCSDTIHAESPLLTESDDAVLPSLAHRQNWELLRSPLDSQTYPTNSVDFLSQTYPASRDHFGDLLHRYSENGEQSFPRAIVRSSSLPSSVVGIWKIRQETRIAIARVESKVDLPDSYELRQIPYLVRDWRAQEKVNVPFPVALPLAEAMFFFGHFESKGDVWNNQHVRLIGKTGIGWKWSPFSGSELQIRGGPSVGYTDVYLPSRFSERSQLSVELQAKLDVWGPLQFQYTGEALAKVQETDTDQFYQDFRLAIPFGSSSNEFQLGARYRWEGIPTPTPWMDRASLYISLEFRH